MFIWIFVHLRNPINVRQTELLTIWLNSEGGEDRFVVVQHLWCRKICQIVCRVSRKWMESKFKWIYVFILWRHSPSVSVITQTQGKRNMSGLSPFALYIIGKTSIKDLAIRPLTHRTTSSERLIGIVVPVLILYMYSCLSCIVPISGVNTVTCWQQSPLYSIWTLREDGIKLNSKLMEDWTRAVRIIGVWVTDRSYTADLLCQSKNMTALVIGWYRGKGWKLATILDRIFNTQLGIPSAPIQIKVPSPQASTRILPSHQAKQKNVCLRSADRPLFFAPTLNFLWHF